MKASSLNYRHLYYFWVAAKEGGITRAAERLGVAVQTISMQLALLEKSIGKTLFAPQGRRLVLTEAGRVALNYADQIFLLGEQLQEILAEDDVGKSLRLTVGITDSLPKMIAYRLLEPALKMSQFVRMECYDGTFEVLMADLALHKLDVVLTDRPINLKSNLRVFSHELGDRAVWLFGTPDLAEKYRDNFPYCINGAPILLPTRNHAIRIRLDHWFEANNIRPFIAGEFSDSALLKTFGRNGIGMFHAPIILADEMKDQYNSVPIGEMKGVREQYYAISAEMKIRHVAVEAILEARRKIMETVD